MRQERREEERAPEAVERFVKQLLVAHKAAKLYPSASDIPQEAASDLLVMLRDLLREQPDLRFQVAKDSLLYNGLPVLPGLRPFEVLVREFYHRNLAELRFHAGVTPREVVSFLRVLQEPVEAITNAGGFEQLLWDLQVDGITVRVVSTKIVDTELTNESTPVPGEEWPPSHDRIDELIDMAYGARPRDQRMLVRFAQSPRLVSRYLNELASGGRGGRPLTNLIAGKVVSLAHVALAELSDDQPALFRSIAEALLSLDPDMRRDVLVEKLLPDSRVDDAVASVMRQFEIGELCKALVEGMGPDPVSRDGISRAIRNLAVISSQPKDEVFAAAASAMSEAGMEQQAIAAVLEGAAPTQLKVREDKTEHPNNLDSILRLVDLAPVAAETHSEELAELRAEVADGVSDGDILVGIVTLVTIERRADMFGSLMGIVDDGLGLLLEWGEYADAAAAAAALAALKGDETLDEGQHERIRLALAGMASQKHMGAVAAAMRLHVPGTPEHEACTQLIGTLGGVTIAPLLEVLAAEKDMAARKALVDIVSTMASEHIGELGERTSDSRWFFVRNVIAILGSTRSAAALPHLNRTLRHNDERVRRETIRAVASIRDRLAEEMLVAALSDDDGQNVALAARYLGSLGVRSALPALAMAARGEGRGNRDTASRVEALEALGKIGTPEARSAIQDVARHRGILRTGRTREIQIAAEAALASIDRVREGDV